VIQIRLCVRFLAAFLTLCAFSAAEGESARGEHQRNASEVPTESKSDQDHYEAGRSLEEQGRYEDAIREFQGAISINSKNSRYYDNLAFCLKELRRYDEAIDVINRAISIDPKDS
jgi:tetratricopeptide (TPR) repeat protein